LHLVGILFPHKNTSVLETFKVVVKIFIEISTILTLN